MSKSSSRARLKEGEDKEDINTISFAPTASAGGGVFEEEPTLNQGVFSALLLAQKKGYVDEEKEKEVSEFFSHFFFKWHRNAINVCDNTTAIECVEFAVLFTLKMMDSRICFETGF